MGLGNPGVRYRNTRHNVGFQVVDAVSAQLHLPLRKPLLRPWRVARGEMDGRAAGGGAGIILAQPLTFMNRSGEAVAPLLQRLRLTPADLLVVCDSLDLPVGRCRLRLRGSSGGQRGLDSIIRRLGTTDFKRLVDRHRPPRASGRRWWSTCWESPGRRRPRCCGEAVRQAAEGILRLLEEEPLKVMNALNRGG